MKLQIGQTTKQKLSLCDVYLKLAMHLRKQNVTEFFASVRAFGKMVFQKFAIWKRFRRCEDWTFQWWNGWWCRSIVFLTGLSSCFSELCIWYWSSVMGRIWIVYLGSDCEIPIFLNRTPLSVLLLITYE